MTAKHRLILTAATWQARAACLTWPDPDDFFPDPGEVSPTALMVCRGCPVRAQCEQTALRNRERHGVWGGMIESDRLTKLRRRPVSVPAVRGA